MGNFSKKMFVFWALIFVFQIIFPQYAYAYSPMAKTVSAASPLAMANLPEPIIFDGQEAPREPGRLPMAGPREPRGKIMVTVTAYSSTVDQCDSDPFTTAMGSQVRDGIVAANFLPFGAKVKLPALFGDKVFVVEDRMNERYVYNVDVWMPTRAEAKQFGVKYVEVEVY